MEDTASLMVDPHMCTVPQRGMVKSTISSLMPFLRAQATVTGITAEEEHTEKAVR